MRHILFLVGVHPESLAAGAAGAGASVAAAVFYQCILGEEMIGILNTRNECWDRTKYDQHLPTYTTLLTAAVLFPHEMLATKLLLLCCHCFVL